MSDNKVEQAVRAAQQERIDRQEQVSDPMGSLRATVAALYAVAIVVGLLGGLGGIFVAAALTEEHDGGYYDTVTTHPYVGLGIGVAVSSIVFAMVIWLLAAWAAAWAHSKVD